ncbi:ComEC/Rec2 family competence protein [Schaalia sp. 19OD2882]|uniref:ComEC/Rec2 family competence protein n=1 Tax=Schaalia sp. 19OD2882 TaxID=2794089 RepID=UPI001C1F0AFB|nr:ComEC/Rec2 family competence protein [Schaalia sp. 19OD2882]QWW19047.1 ComEC/Rec2 family competence protein [Schaalia sp. 19OD2882]
MPEVTPPRVRDLRLLAPAVALWVGAWVGTSEVALAPAWAGATLVAGGLTLVAIPALAQRASRRPRHAAAPVGSLLAAAALVLCALGVGLSVGWAAQHQRQADPVVTLARDPPAQVELLLRLEADPRSSTARWERGAMTVRARVDGSASGATVLLRARGMESLARGDLVRAKGGLDPAFPVGGTWIGTLHADQVNPVERPGGWRGISREVRASLVRVCGDLDPQAQGLVPGFAIGDDSRLPHDLAEAMRATSLTHLTAVSGAHVAILMAVVMLPFRNHRVLGVLVPALVLAALVALVGPEPSVLRAVSLAAVLMVGTLARRPGSAEAALSLVAAAFILADPWASRSFGLVLSVAAAWAVLVPAHTWDRVIRRKLAEGGPARTLVRAVARAATVPLACQIVVAPILLLLRPNLPTWGVLANVLAAPAVAPATLLSLAATALAPVVPGPAHALAQAAAVFTGWIAGVAEHLAAWPWAGLPLATGPGPLALVLALGAGGRLAWTWGRGRWNLH